MEFLDLESIPGVETVPVKMLTLFVTILAATAMVLGGEYLKKATQALILFIYIFILYLFIYYSINQIKLCVWF